MALAENLVSTGKWIYFADTVMGGVSDGRASFVEEDAALRLVGTVSTANNGGFIQVRTKVSSKDAMGKTGVVIEAKGNGETYNIHLRNRSTRLPWHYYAATFEASEAWSRIEIPFTEFKKSSSLLRGSINTETIKSLGVVAYGKDYQADVQVRYISFY